MTRIILLTAVVVGCGSRSGSSDETSCIEDPEGHLVFSLAEDIVDRACHSGVEAGLDEATSRTADCLGQQEVYWIFEDDPVGLADELCHDWRLGVERDFCEAAVYDQYFACFEATAVRTTAYMDVFQCQ